jgi:hypothetical protein
MLSRISPRSLGLITWRMGSLGGAASSLLAVLARTSPVEWSCPAPSCDLLLRVVGAVVQLALSSQKQSEAQLYDYAQYRIRQTLTQVPDEWKILVRSTDVQGQEVAKEVSKILIQADPTLSVCPGTY